MKLSTVVWVMMALMLVLGQSWAQSDNNAPVPDGTEQSDNAQQSDNSQQSDTAPAPAYGGNGAQPSNENPPISGLDQPSLEPGAISRSFLLLGAHAAQSIHSNVSSSTTNSSLTGISSAFGSIALQRIWSRYQASLDYVGGASYYNQRSIGWHQVHSLDSDGRFLWRTGQLALRDAFSFLPQGAFGLGSFGGAGAIAGIGSLGGPLSGGGTAGGIGGTQFFGPGQFASVGQQPRISNVSVADLTQMFSPRTSITVAGSYGLVHFVDSPTGLLDSRQVGSQVGLNYQIGRRDQIGLLYGYQHFLFPDVVAGSLNTHLAHVTYGHRISGRMDFVLAGGPQIVQRNSPVFGSSTSLSASGRASFRYHFTRASLAVSYNHYNTSGSGFFAGAKSDVVNVTASRPFGRYWTATADSGFAHSTRLLPVPQGITPQAFNNALYFNYVYAGASVHRQLNRQFSIFVSYQFNQLMFDRSVCGNSSACARTSNAHIGVVGLDWHPHPIRID